MKEKDLKQNGGDVFQIIFANKRQLLSNILIGKVISILIF